MEHFLKKSSIDNSLDDAEVSVHYGDMLAQSEWRETVHHATSNWCESRVQVTFPEDLNQTYRSGNCL